MTPDERQMLSGLFDRIRGAATGPKDAEAEAFINDSMRQTPSAAYVMAQTVLVQQNALEVLLRDVQDACAPQSFKAPLGEATDEFGYCMHRRERTAMACVCEKPNARLTGAHKAYPKRCGVWASALNLQLDSRASRRDG